MSAYGPLMISIESLQLDSYEKKLLHDPCVGGVILFQRNYKDPIQLTQLTTAIKEIDENIIIAVDQEGGRVQRFKGQGFTRLPAMRLLGHFYEHHPKQAYALSRELGARVGQELKQFHIDCNFAPVLDIDTGRSSVIGDRAYHQDFEVITTLAAAYLQGLHSAGLLGVGKHCPGHGSVVEDTHHDMAHDPRPYSLIYHNDLYPYQYLIHENLLDAIMMAHVVYPTLDSIPASQSKRWMNGVLRQEMGFQGIIFSDDLSMKGFQAHPMGAEKILNAGCNMLIVCNDRDLIDLCLKQLTRSKQLDDYATLLKRKWQSRKEDVLRTAQKFSFCEDFTQQLDDLLRQYGS